MKLLAQKGLEQVRREYTEREDVNALHDLEVETEFWLSVDLCEDCDTQMCSAHYTWFVGGM